MEEGRREPEQDSLVEVSFIGSKWMESGVSFRYMVCRYNIRIESLLGEQLQLRERYWRICSMSGTLETVKGKGVIGQVRGGEGGVVS